MKTYASLRSQGIRHLEEMTGRGWTDFNAHDPGITLLEQLCYALTDLSYRTAYDVPDLLADGGDNSYASLHEPAKILPTRAVTTSDLRRLVLNVPGVKNAWIEPVAEPLADGGASLKGMYRVLIEPSGKRSGSVVRREAGVRLYLERGLCEDFADIVILEPQKICVDATVEIGRVDDPTELRRQILDALAEVIAPSVRFSTLDELLSAGKSVGEIFDGPSLDPRSITEKALAAAPFCTTLDEMLSASKSSGEIVEGRSLDQCFITEEALAAAPRKSAIHTSDLIHAIMDLPGARAVTKLRVEAGKASDAWSLDVAPDRAPQLDRAASTITLLSTGLEIAADDGARDEVHPAAKKIEPSIGLAPPKGRNRNAGNYMSVQHHLPAIYGVGEVGLPDSAPPERRARAKQLTAYLMFFDQLMANYLAQLAHMKDLFSHGPLPTKAEPSPDPTPRTYFSCPVTETETETETALRFTDVCTASQTDLDALTETSDPTFARKHRFLNHLLARFAESLDERYVAAQVTGGPDPVKKLLADKRAFLQNYPRLSAARGTAFYSLGPWGTANPSGLEERLRLKLGLVTGEEMILVEHILLPSEMERIPLRNGKQSFALFEAWLKDNPAVNGKDAYSLQLTFVLRRDQGRFTNSDFRKLVEQTIRAQTPAHLTAYVAWVDGDTWTAFIAEHAEWRRMRREHLASNLGLSLGLDRTLRATLDDNGAMQLLVHFNDSFKVIVERSQEAGASYSLLSGKEDLAAEATPSGMADPSGARTISEALVIGNGGNIEITSKAMTEDTVVRVGVERASDDPIVLNAGLKVFVRADPNVGVVVGTPAPDGKPLPPFVDQGGSVNLTLGKSQASVTYSVYAKTLSDEDFTGRVGGKDTPGSLEIPGSPSVPPSPSPPAGPVRVNPPPHEAWSDREAYKPLGAATAGNGGDLSIDVGSIAKDTLVVVKAHKNHEGSTLGESDVQLAKPVLVLMRPSPVPGLRLQMVDGKVTATGGQQGVFYYLRDTEKGLDLGLPLYFQRTDDAKLPVNRGVGHLRVGRDFVVSRRSGQSDKPLAITPPPTPRGDFPTVTAGSTVSVMAVFARTGVPWAEARSCTVAY